MKKPIFYILGLAIAFSIIYLLFFNNPMKDFGLSGDLIKEFNFERETQVDTIFLTGYNRDNIIKIKKTHRYSESLAQQYIADKIFVINSQYREVHSPYPGRLSNRIGCEDEFKPIKINNSPFDYYEIYSTDRFTYGACSWDLITYRSILYFVYCENTSAFYQIQLFLPLDEEVIQYEEKLKLLICS